jgi:hypothetical protein
VLLEQKFQGLADKSRLRDLRAIRECFQFRRIFFRYQKIELLQTLWSIMSAFVDLAFGTDPVQQTLPSLAAGQHEGPTGSAATPAERE